MEKKHLASIKNFLASASVAAESCEVMLAKVQREKPLSRLPVATNFGNGGKQLKPHCPTTWPAATLANCI